jgi:hypothetical protein
MFFYACMQGFCCSEFTPRFFSSIFFYTCSLSLLGGAVRCCVLLLVHTGTVFLALLVFLFMFFRRIRGRRGNDKLACRF